MFAAVDMTVSDALITAWRAKLFYGIWRPSTAIQLADTDGNPATTADPTWTPLLVNPPYPDYVSGYNSYTASLTRALEELFGRRHLDLNRDSPQTVETSVVVITARAGWPCRARARRGQAWPCPLSLLPGAAGVPGVKGGPQGRRAPARCAAPLRPGWRPRTLSGRDKASGGAAATFARPAQRARRAHAASFPASDRS